MAEFPAFLPEFLGSGQTVPGNLTPPSIAGVAEETELLTVNQGTWSGEPTAYAWQWTRCNNVGTSCAAIGGATGANYTLTAADVGHTIRVEETASNVLGSATGTSAATAVVTGASVPTNTSVPTVSGLAKQGELLTASPGTWTSNPIKYLYQWQRCSALGLNCTNIGGATNPTYTLTGPDVGSTVRIQVIAENTHGVSSPAYSGATGVVQPSGAVVAGAVIPNTFADIKPFSSEALISNPTFATLKGLETESQLVVRHSEADYYGK